MKKVRYPEPIKGNFSLTFEEYCSNKMRTFYLIYWLRIQGKKCMNKKDLLTFIELALVILILFGAATWAEPKVSEYFKLRQKAIQVEAIDVCASNAMRTVEQTGLKTVEVNTPFYVKCLEDAGYTSNLK